MQRKYKKKGVETKNWVDAYMSKEGGQSWEFQSKVGDSGEGYGNPPSLAQTQDGRFVAVFGERKTAPFRALSALTRSKAGGPRRYYTTISGTRTWNIMILGTHACCGVPMAGWWPFSITAPMKPGDRFMQQSGNRNNTPCYYLHI